MKMRWIALLLLGCSGIAEDLHGGIIGCDCDMEVVASLPWEGDVCTVELRPAFDGALSFEGRDALQCLKCPGNTRVLTQRNGEKILVWSDHDPPSLDEVATVTCD
jgi:hypothetical protein